MSKHEHQGPLNEEEIKDIFDKFPVKKLETIVNESEKEKPVLRLHVVQQDGTREIQEWKQGVEPLPYFEFGMFHTEEGVKAWYDAGANANNLKVPASYVEAITKLVLPFLGFYQPIGQSV